MARKIPHNAVDIFSTTKIIQYTVKSTLILPRDITKGTPNYLLVQPGFLYIQRHFRMPVYTGKYQHLNITSKPKACTQRHISMSVCIPKFKHLAEFGNAFTGLLHIQRHIRMPVYAVKRSFCFFSEYFSLMNLTKLIFNHNVVSEGTAVKHTLQDFFTVCQHIPDYTDSMIPNFFGASNFHQQVTDDV